MRRQLEPKIAVLCDFDGTITLVGVLDLIYKTFAAPECWQLVEAWMRREISTADELQGCFASITASRKELEAALDTVPLDPSFPDFIRFCAEGEYPLVILSDGLRWYIEYILQRHGIGGLPIIANEIEFSPEGYHFDTPWYHAQTPHRGVSKPAVIQSYQDQGYRVDFIGDGLSDLEAVSVADKVYARDALLEYCEEHHIPATGFTSLGELIRKWRL